jgi:hypothetical protein
MADLIISSPRDKLRTELAALKEIYESPIIYLKNYFVLLRNHVDKDLTEKIKNEKLKKKKETLNETLRKMLEKIDKFETECLSSVDQNQQINQNTDLISQFDKIEVMLTDLTAKNLEEINESIQSEEIYILKQLFQNKTIAYFVNSIAKNSTFESANSKIDGKLVLINDEFIRPKAFKQM